MASSIRRHSNKENQFLPCHSVSSTSSIALCAHTEKDKESSTSSVQLFNCVLQFQRYNKIGSISAAASGLVEWISQMKKSLVQMVKMPQLAGAFHRHCNGGRTDDDKVRLLSVVSRSSLSDDVPLMDDMNSSATPSTQMSDIEERFHMDSTQNKSTFIDDSQQSPIMNQLIDVTESVAPAHTKASHIASENKQSMDEEKRHEWVFTLYDFDGKGTPNKEDILSIVRAIYDVLGNAKIRARTIPNKMDKNNNSGDCGNRQMFGAFKIKLSLTAVENADVAISPSTADSKSHDEYRIVQLRRRKKQTKTVTQDNSGGKIKAQPTKAQPTAADSTKEDESPVLRHHKKPTKRRGCGAGLGVERHSPPPLHSRKIYRRSASFSQSMEQPTTSICNPPNEYPMDNGYGSCTYRDYVNLSELENCCSSGSHHDQQRHSRGVVHHIRHCDRHCHCPISDLNPTMPGKLWTRNARCLHATPTTAVIRRCSDMVQQSPQKCCQYAAPSSTSMHVNVQARAYYQERTAANVAHQKRLSLHYDQSILASVNHDKKQRSRDKDRVLSTDRVKSWIMNDSNLTPPPPVPVPVLEKEQRGVADGSEKIYVEHKHIHKHNHYHHFY